MGWKWAQVDMNPLQGGEEFYGKGIHLDSTFWDLWRVCIGVTSVWCDAKIAVRIYVNEYIQYQHQRREWPSGRMVLLWESPSGLRRYNKNPKIPGSNPIRRSTGLWDPASLRGSLLKLLQRSNQHRINEAASSIMPENCPWGTQIAVKKASWHITPTTNYVYRCNVFISHCSVKYG